MPESFPMNGGDGAYSYTKNSQYQRKASSVAKGLIQKAIAESLDVQRIASDGKTFRIVDLGCSVGPNTFFAVQDLIDAVKTKYTKKLQFHVFFNDHVSNDFNTLFTSLPPERQYFSAGVPGSFYNRVLPSSSIHLAYSSYALHWLCEVPEELTDKASPGWNKGKIHYSSASDEVKNAYASQFQRDMEIFLQARAEEIVPGGMIVLVMAGLSDEVHYSQHPASFPFSVLGSCLADMVNEGIVEEEKLDSFNVPIYYAPPNEMAKVVTKNGCFSIKCMKVTYPTSELTDAELPSVSGYVKHLRAVMEGIFTNHFGSEATEEMFQRAQLQKHAEFQHWLNTGYRKDMQLFAALKRN